jgi:FlaA1/EpsC-like NDP-sugar epimerase
MRNRYVFLADLGAVATAAFGAFVLRFGWAFLPHRTEFFGFLAAALLIKPAVFYTFSLYGRYWRYATVRDLYAVVLACITAGVLMALFVGVAIPLDLLREFSRPVLVVDTLLTLLAAGGLRMSIRAVHEPRRGLDRGGPDAGPGDEARRRVLVVGAGDAGAMVVREMRRNPQLNMNPVAFLDDNLDKVGKHIYDVPVYGGIDSLERVARRLRVDEVVIAMPTAPGAAVRAVVGHCQACGLRSRIIPGVFELLGGQISVSRLRHVEIVDLLRRPQVLDGDPINRYPYVTGKTVLVTGAGGSIGHELCRQVAHADPACLVLLGNGENSLFEAQARLQEAVPHVPLRVVVADVRNARRLQQTFERFSPEVVFHAAAHKHVHFMEDNFEEAISNNVIGTLNVVNTALEAGTERLVSISTDKAVSPAGIMGASKRMAGLIVRSAGEQQGRKFVVVRFGNVLGSRGSAVPYFKRQIEAGGPVTVTDPRMKRFFMTISEAVHLVLEAGGMARGAELFVLDMGEPVRIMDLAGDLIRLSGFTTDQIPIVITGRRPGEKLEERLWEEGAVVSPTAHADILGVTEPPGPDLADLPAAVRRLEAAAVAGDRVGVETILTEWIPTFSPSSGPADLRQDRPGPRLVRGGSPQR